MLEPLTHPYSPALRSPLPELGREKAFHHALDGYEAFLHGPDQGGVLDKLMLRLRYPVTLGPDPLGLNHVLTEVGEAAVSCEARLFEVSMAQTSQRRFFLPPSQQEVVSLRSALNGFKGILQFLFNDGLLWNPPDSLRERVITQGIWKAGDDYHRCLETLVALITVERKVSPALRARTLMFFTGALLCLGLTT